MIPRETVESMGLVYLSAPSAEIPRARGVRTALHAEGLAVLGSGWIESVEQYGSDAYGDRDREAIPCGWRRDIRRSHVVLVLAPIETSTRCLYREFEMALAADVPVIVSCCSPLERVPLALVDRDARLRERWWHVLDDQSAIALAVRIARRAAGAT